MELLNLDNAHDFFNFCNAVNRNQDVTFKANGLTEVLTFVF